MSIHRPLNSYPIPNELLTKLILHGFDNYNDVIELSVSQLSSELQIEPEQSLLIFQILRENNNENINNIKQNILKKSHNAAELYNIERKKNKIITLSLAIDQCLNGGISRGEITEFCGVPGIGKTQIAMQLACNVQIPHQYNGVNGQVVYIDTEGSLIAERVASIASSLIQHIDKFQIENNLTVESILSNIFTFRIHDYIEQICCIKYLSTFIKQHNQIKLIIIDSIAFHFRRDFKNMSERSSILSNMINDLLQLASTYDIAIVLTNHVTTKPYQ